MHVCVYVSAWWMHASECPGLLRLMRQGVIKVKQPKDKNPSSVVKWTDSITRHLVYSEMYKKRSHSFKTEGPVFNTLSTTCGPILNSYNLSNTIQHSRSVLKMSALHKSLKWQLPRRVGEWLTCTTEALGAQRRVPQRGPERKRSSCRAPPRPGTGLGQSTAASGHAPSASGTGRVISCWTSHRSLNRTAAWPSSADQLSDARERSRKPSVTSFIRVSFQFTHTAGFCLTMCPAPLMQLIIK